MKTPSQAKREYRAASPEKYRETDRLYRKNNREKICASRNKSAALYREKHRSVLRAKALAYVDANRESVNKAQAIRRDTPERREKARKDAIAHYAANREKCLAVCATWKKSNPILVRQSNLKRELKKRGTAVGNIKLIEAWEANWRSKPTVRCHWCGKRFDSKKCQTDHVIPLSKGGEHAVENLAASCAGCNRRKSAKSPEEFNRTLGKPLLFV